MRSRDIVEDYPLVAMTDPAADAARYMADHRLPGVVVVDRDSHPVTVLPAALVLRFLVPTYVQEDPSLARVYDERTAESVARTFRGRTVEEMLPAKGQRRELAVVSGDATLITCSAMMARLQSPLLVVMEEETIIGVITASRLLQLLLED